MTMQLFFKDNLKLSAFPPPALGFLNIDAHMYQIDPLAPVFFELHIKIRKGFNCLLLVFATRSAAKFEKVHSASEIPS